MYRTHEQIFNALSGYPDVESIDLFKVTHENGEWKNGQRELKMTLPPMTCWVHVPEDKNFVVLSLAVDDELHAQAVEKLDALLVKAKETGFYSTDSVLVRPAPKEGQRPNIVLYVSRKRFDAMCSESRKRHSDVVDRASIVSVKVAIGRPGKVEKPIFGLFPHELTFLKTYKSKGHSNDHSADDILGTLSTAVDDDLEVEAVTIPKKKAPARGPKKTGAKVEWSKAPQK